jgi:quinol monooxygenase YgiN
MLVQTEVEDYAKWRSVFDSLEGFRKENGQKSAHVMRSADNSNSITALSEWDTMENARQYAQSPELKEAMQRAGVTSAPSISFLDEG